MRLIEKFNEEKQAFTFYSFLLREGIGAQFETAIDPESKKMQFLIWIQDEDDFDKAIEYLNIFKESPDDPRFKNIEPAGFVPPKIPESGLKAKLKINLKEKEPGSNLTLSNFFIAICVFIFFWNGIQEADMIKKKGALSAELGMTTLQTALIFDYPKSFQLFNQLLSQYPMKSLEEVNDLPPEGKKLFQEAEAAPTWKGVYDWIVCWKKTGNTETTPLFEKIRQGEIWRIFTPCLLHRDFLHILFNMAWVWVLGKQIEERIGKWRLLWLVLITGIVANVAQYLMSGPYFLGFSGVVVGMAGFIWVRQKLAPWEGYPLQKATALFLLVFVVAMFLLEIGSFLFQLFSAAEVSANIANTAHIVGGLVGMLLARIPLFSRGVK